MGVHVADDHGDDPGGRPAWPRWWAARLAWALWTLVVLGLTVTPWLNQLARRAGRSDLGSDANTAIYGLVAVSAATVGAVLASRRPRHPVGWLLLALGLWFTYGYASCWGWRRWRLGRSGNPTKRSTTRSLSVLWPVRCWRCAAWPLRLPVLPSRSAPGHWWCASAAPVGESASSDGGWRWRRHR